MFLVSICALYYTPVPGERLGSSCKCRRTCTMHGVQSCVLTLQPLQALRFQGMTLKSLTRTLRSFFVATPKQAAGAAAAACYCTGCGDVCSCSQSCCCHSEECGGSACCGC